MKSYPRISTNLYRGWLSCVYGSESKAEKFEKMAEGTAKDKDQLTWTTIRHWLVRRVRTSLLWLVGTQIQRLHHLLESGSHKNGVMFGDPTTSPGGDSPKFYALYVSVLVHRWWRMVKRRSARRRRRMHQKQSCTTVWQMHLKFYFDPTRGLDVIESLVEYIWKKDTCQRTPAGELKLVTRIHQIADRRDVSGEATGWNHCALQAIDDRRAKDNPTESVEDKHKASTGRLFYLLKIYKHLLLFSHNNHIGKHMIKIYLLA